MIDTFKIKHLRSMHLFVSRSYLLYFTIFVLFLFFPVIENNIPIPFILPIFFIFSILIVSKLKLPIHYFLLLPLFYFFFMRNMIAIGSVNLGAVLSFPFYWFVAMLLILAKIKLNRTFVFFIILSFLFFSVLFINTFNSSISSFFLVFNKYLYQFQMIPLLIIGYYFGDKFDLNHLFNFSFKIIGILSLVFLFTYYLDWNYSYSHAKAGHWDYRLTGFERNPNFLASLYVPFLGTSLLLTNKSKSQLLFLFFGIWVFFLTDSRGNLLAYVISTSIVFLSFQEHRKTLKNLIFKRFYILMALLFLLIIVFSVSNTRFVTDIMNFILKSETVGNERFIIWPQYLDKFQEKPYFGHGLIKEITAIGGRGIPVKYIDSNYIQALVRYGLIGFIIVFIPYFVYLKLTIKIYRTDKSTFIVPATFIVYAILGHLIFGIFTFSENLPPLQISIFFIGMMIKSNSSSNKNKNLYFH